MELLEVLIWNDKEARVASLVEMTNLVEDGSLFVNYYIMGADVGKAFVDVTHDDFSITSTEVLNAA